jgi:hypothetical protein
MIPGLTEGRIVHYVLHPAHPGDPLEHRPAIVVKDLHEASGSCNMQVFVDGTNDRGPIDASYPLPTTEETSRGVAWRTSVVFSATPQPGTWHWPEKVELGHEGGERIAQTPA